MAEGTQRRLAAIVAIDVAGYSRLMGADEEGTIAALQSHRREIVDPKLAQYNGRIANTAGDSLLIEFPSAVDALRCAVDLQAEFVRRNADVPDERRFQYRIGINVGDVVSQGDDLLGDGVNVAARLEGLAEPGGICISRTARDQVRDRMDVELADMGEVEVKNIARPVRVFRVLGEGEEAEAPVPGAAWWKYVAAAIVVLAIITGGGVWWWMQQPEFEVADPKGLPDKPSIAVLAFDNFTGVPDRQFLADGFAEQLITVLSRNPDILVIARGSSFRYRDKKGVKYRQIAEELRVRYLIEGSLQQAGDRIRLNVQLVDAVKGFHTWSKSYDRPASDFFVVQDEVIAEISSELLGRRGEIMAAEISRLRAKAPKDLSVFELGEKATIVAHKRTREANEQSRELIQQMLDRDPDNARAHAFMAWYELNAIWFRWTDDSVAATKRACNWAEKAVTLDPREYQGHWASAFCYGQKGLPEKQRQALEKAVKLNPGGTVLNITYASYALIPTGKIDEAIRRLKIVERTNPRGNVNRQLHPALSRAFYYNKDHERSLDYISRLTGPASKALGFRTLRIAALYQTGKRAEAQDEVKALLKDHPQYSIAEFRKFPGESKAYLDSTATLLRDLGVPENPPGIKPKKPAIAVLPFANLSDDKEQEYFADGMTDDLITDLSKVSGLIVIARNSVFTYKGRNVKVQEVAKDLNVTHVLEGSVRRAGGKVRINAQLIDAKTGAHLWAEKFDRDFNDVFKLQDAVTAEITAALKVALTPAEQQILAKPPTENVKAYDHYLKAEALRLTYHWDNFGNATYEYNQALKLDPSFVAAHLGLSRTMTLIWRNGWLEAVVDPNIALVTAQAALSKIEQLSPGNSLAAALNVKLTILQGDLKLAQRLAEDAIAKHPENAELQLRLAEVLINQGRHSEALKAAERALLFAPRPDGELWTQLAYVFGYLGESARAVDLLKRARKVGADIYETAFIMARALLDLGDLSAAKREAKTIMGRWPHANLNWLRVLYQHSRDSEIENRYFTPLARVGIPEWPIMFNESTRLNAEALTKLFKSPYTIKGAGFSVEGIKGDLVCVKQLRNPMGRTYCRPVYRDAEYLRLYAHDRELVSPSIHYPGYDAFSITHKE